MILSFLTSSILSWIMIVVWLAIFIIALYVEIHTTQMVSIWFAFSAIAPAIMAACGVQLWIQFLVFTISCVVLFLISRPIAKKLTKTKPVATNVDELIGEIVKVTKEIPVDGKGEVKAKYDRYDAIAPSADSLIPVDTKVVVKEISGNKVIVELIK